MNIYVVSNCWWRDGATVIGAATERAGAKEIAGRADDWDDPSITGWSEWRTGSAKPDGEVTAWIRDALTAKGIHVSLYQEIVCVPLAGYPDFGDVVTVNKTPVVSGTDRLTVTEQVVDAVRMVVAEARSAGLVLGYETDRISVGDGAGKEYMRRVFESVPQLPPIPPWETGRVGASIAGLPIVIDPTMPPDEMRIGTMVYVIGTAGGFVPEGSMVRIDEGIVRALTNPPT